MHVPDTGWGGLTSFNRYYFAQTDRDAAIIDERYNHGGLLADYIVENMNRKIDKNFIGIPKEGYGTSNNPKKAWHEPRWNEAKFSVSRPAETITIKTIYW